MDIIQVTNPNFPERQKRAMIVANARCDLQLAGDMRTLRYHRKTFLTKDETDRKWLVGRLAEMEKQIETMKAHQEATRKEKERRRQSIVERNEMYVDRSAADENSVQMMKKLIW